MTRRWFNGLLVLVMLWIGVAQLPHTTAQTDTGNSGQVALIGADQNVYVYDVATDTLTAITDDAQRERFYVWPTWSWDGQLAYFGASRLEDDAYNLGIFVKPDPFDAITHFHKTTGDAFTYASWSPADCPAGDCRDLFVLYTSERGTLAVRRLRSRAEEFEVDEIAEGQPFYWDWSPDGQSMLWTRFGRTLEIYDVASDEVIDELDVAPGFQRSVDWSPVDDRLLSTVLNDTNRRSDLVVFDGDEQHVLAESLRGNIAFQWSPNGTQVAYLVELTGDLVIVDAVSGTVTAEPASDVVVFQWSPTGDKIAYITIGQPGSNTVARPSEQQTPFLIWHVYNTETDTNKQIAAFLPTQAMIYYFQFFDQFTRSHSLWSPDGKFLVYGQIITEELRQVVSIVDVTAPNPRPVEISEGDIGIFSWQ